MALRSSTLSLRADIVGGGLNYSPDLKDVKATLTGRTLTLLIHGYNNTQDAAATAYDAFFDVQRELAGAANLEEMPADRDFVKVFWPGDGWGVAGSLFYPVALGRAKEAALILVQALEELAAYQGGSLTIEVIGHSMGCRLALELMKHLELSPMISVYRVVFMAAAVPIVFLEDVAHVDSLYAAYEATCKAGGLSLYSPADAVLSGAFPIGETASAGEPGGFPVALGHDFWQTGHPLSRFEQAEIAGAGHSDYWGWVLDTRERCAIPTGRAVRSFLKFVWLGEAAVASAEISDRRPDDRPLSSRDLAYRQLAARAV